MHKSIYCLAMIAGVALNMSAAQAEPMARKNMDNYFKEMDANSDGVIAREEFDAMHNKRFQEMDTDRDNKLTREEMGEAMQKRRAADE